MDLEDVLYWVFIGWWWRPIRWVGRGVREVSSWFWWVIPIRIGKKRDDGGDSPEAR